MGAPPVRERLHQRKDPATEGLHPPAVAHLTVLLTSSLNASAREIPGRLIETPPKNEKTGQMPAGLLSLGVPHCALEPLKSAE